MIDVDSLLKEIYTEDTIYHYTKANTAIDFILYNQELRFNSSRKSNDPIESRTARRSTVYTGADVDRQKELEEILAVEELHKYTTHLENQFHQICFCKNKKGGLFGNQYYTSSFSGHEELFGFTKLRMWEQYADNYSGVCFAFSKEKILSLNKNKFDLLANNVKYLKFKNLPFSKIGNIQGNHVFRVGKEKYKRQIEKIVKKAFFIKHEDYKGENEFKIGTYYDKKKCNPEYIKGELILDNSMMLGIAGCIKAIFFSSYANENQKNELLNYAKKHNVPLIEIAWQHDSFELKDYKGWIELIEKFKQK